MKKASALFSKDERHSIEKAVGEVEQATSADILPVVATVSGRYDRAEDIFGLLFAVAALAIIWCAFPDNGGDKWTASQSSMLGLFGVVGVIVAGFIVGAALATRFPVLRLAFIPHGEMKDEVEKRAAEVFYNHHIRHAKGGAGVLIYVSLYERMVRVLTDDAVAAKIGDSEWTTVHTLLADGMRHGHPATGMEKAIRKTGELLAKHFPGRGEKKTAKSLLHFD